MDVDWRQLFVPQTSLVELVLRGSTMYLFLFVLLRILVRRHIGSMSLMDLLLVVLIADAAQNAMAGQYQTITEGVVLCVTLIAWNYLLDWVGFCFPKIGRLLEPPPLLLVRDGQMQRRNMKLELLSEQELMSQLRQQGITELSAVSKAYIESDGMFSVIRTDRKQNQKSPKRQKGAAV